MIFISIIIGGLCGVIINYLADVLPIYRKPGIPLCRDCAHRFTLYNYLIAFRCKNCGRGVSLRTILVHIFSIFTSVFVWLYPYQNLGYWWSIPLIIFLGVILVIDIEYRVVLIQTSIVGLIVCFVIGMISKGISFNSLVITAVGGLAGFLIMIILYYFGILFNKIFSKARNQVIDEVALGFGDVYVTTFLGFLIGWPNIISVIIIAILLSGVFSLLYILIKLFTKKYKAFSAIPYTPFLILSAVILPYILR